MIARLSRGLEERGYEVDVAPTSSEALERTKYTSHRGVVFDADPTTAQAKELATSFRSQPGMGLVPVLYTVAAERQVQLADLVADRSAVRSRDDPHEVIVQTLERLRRDTRVGRTFVRYDTSFAVVMRYGGRVFQGEVINVSRGGLMIRSGDQMPPIGTQVGVSMRLPGEVAPVEVQSRVARVELYDEGASKVGVEFENFVGRCEPIYISFLCTLDAALPTRRSQAPEERLEL
ncbi:MAG: PilZ domain-containing protein [Myxococcota bacterium]